MNSKEKIKKYWKPILAGMLLLFGLYLTITEEFKIQSRKDIIDKAPQVTFAKVVEIKSRLHGTDVTYRYKTNNENYSSEFSIKGHNVLVGDSIKIRYSKEYPVISEIIEE